MTPGCVWVFVVAALIAAPTARPLSAQKTGSADTSVAGTWTLVSIEEAADGAQPFRVPNPRGLLVLDGAGMVFEAVTRLDRARPTKENESLTDAQRVFATYSGFWGRYKTDPQTKTMTAHAEGALSPNVMGRDWTRTFTIAGDRMTLTSAAVEPHQRGITKWVWEKVPTVDGLGSDYRKVVGFWQHVVEKRVNVTLKTEVATTRAPSLIVYTPSGYVGVYFPPMSATKPFAGKDPTDDEARAVLRGFVGYFGALTVYPGQVFHHIQAGISPLGAQTLKRFFDLEPSGEQVNLRFPVGVNQQGEQTTTLVTMKRLSGAKDMLGQ
jgi:hypothetical protein